MLEMHITCFVCTDVLPSDEKPATGRLSRIIVVCFRVLAAHVRAKIARVPPRDPFQLATTMIAALSSSRRYYRQGHLGVYFVSHPHCTNQFTVPIK